MALPKQYRLAKKDIGRVFKQGKTVKGSFLFIKFLRNDLSHYRATISIPAKVLKKATARNWLKRIMAETIKSSNLYKKPLDVVVVITASSSKILEKGEKEIKRDLEQTINKIFV